MDDRVAITLLRHGMTELNEQKRYSGWNDDMLSEKGRTQLSLQAQSVKVKPDVVITSDLLRAKQTAAILFPSSPTTSLSSLREYHFGQWDKKSYDELKQETLYRQWLDNPLKVAPPGGESYGQFIQRLKMSWTVISSWCQEKSVSTIVVVCHGGTIRGLLELYAPIQQGFWNWSVPYGSGYSLIDSRHNIKEGKRCTLLQEVPLTEKANGQKNTIN
ncbi:histidine phosphatase family protein [Alkalihalobacterium bogoriense]|uniref:histidine phosphatase family protein n=1 Tax=Alkalihalobacterium bogoriense TaxID=246272 RepID=UPI000479C428|nr:histidine phosphatase family protein [Alkalihalobacterium bogoriense]